MTMQELARLAGVTVSTVSKAFSGSEEVSEAVRERIFTLAKENKCYYKYLKISNYKHLIGVICPEFKSGVYSQQLSYLEKEINKRGSLMLAAADNFDMEQRKSLVSYFCGQMKASGIIMYGGFESEESFTVPIVVIGNTDSFDAVVLSKDAAMCSAIEHFAENGHTKIAYIGEANTYTSLDAFKTAMEKMGMDIYEEYIKVEEHLRFEIAGYEAMKRLLDLKNPPTAVMAAYDNIAFGAIKAITERGLKVPEDISIIGNDDSTEGEYFNVPLTTISPYSGDLCEILIDELFRKIENRRMGHPRKIKLSYELVKRGSVAKISSESSH